MVFTSSTTIAAVVGALLTLIFSQFSEERKNINTKNRLFDALKTEIRFIEDNIKDYLDQESMNDSFGNSQLSKLKPTIYPPLGLLRHAGIDQFLRDKRVNEDIYSYYYNVSMAEKYNDIELGKRFPDYHDKFYTVIVNVHKIGNKLTKKLDRIISWNKYRLGFLYAPVFIILVIIGLVVIGIV